jgi:hypothetical protein
MWYVAIVRLSQNCVCERAALLSLAPEPGACVNLYDTAHAIQLRFVFHHMRHMKWDLL